MTDAQSITLSFYGLLRNEVTYGNPYLSDDEQLKLQGHHKVIMNADQYPPKLARLIYVSRRSYAIESILSDRAPVIFDVGCGYGSESFMFASLGARVLSVDRSSRQIEIALKRKRYFEEKFGKTLDITFRTGDLNDYVPEEDDISLSWVASVLAAIPDQDSLLRRVCSATKIGGRIMVTDMNLLNPLFLWKEWKRRRRALKTCFDFAQHARFSDMLRRKNRVGALYYGKDSGGRFDDVQFFHPKTLMRLLTSTGFRIDRISFSGFVPPLTMGNVFCATENFLRKIPVIKTLGYFYTVTGIKQSN